MEGNEYYFGTPGHQRIAILYEILKFIRTREVGFIPAAKGQIVRFQNIGAISYLEERLNELRDIDFHFFASIQRVQHTDGEGHYLDIRDNWQEYTYGWDFVVDIDGEGNTSEEKIDDAYKKALKVDEVYHNYGLPYSIVFSGAKGFHFWVMWDEIKQYFKASDYGIANKALTKFIAKKSGVKLDMAVASKDKTLIRVPYSINPHSQLVCLPLTDEQFIDFKPSIAEPETIYKSGIRNRGMRIREGTLKDFMEAYDGRGE